MAPHNCTHKKKRPPVRRGTRNPMVTTAQAQDRFLKAYLQVGTVQAAARVSKVGRRTHYSWLARDSAYAARYTEAFDAACDMAESELRRRGVDGILEPLVFQGKKTGHTIRRYSDVCLIFYLK